MTTSTATPIIKRLESRSSATGGCPKLLMTGIVGCWFLIVDSCGEEPCTTEIYGKAPQGIRIRRERRSGITRYALREASNFAALS